MKPHQPSSARPSTESSGPVQPAFKRPSTESSGQVQAASKSPWNPYSSANREQPAGHHASTMNDDSCEEHSGIKVDQSPAQLIAKPQETLKPSVDPASHSSTKTNSPKKYWEWPPWVLDSHKPDIEVFVCDDETGESRWVEAVPQCRIVDANGHDSFLSAAYEWDGELYDQDFEPDHVRKRGSQISVRHLLCN